MSNLIRFVCALLAVGVASAQSAVIVPSTVDQLTPGNSATGWPWDRTSGDPIRIQYCYDSSHFAAIAMPMLITELRFRAQEGASVSWSGGTYADVVVTVGAAGVDQASMSPLFDANWPAGRAPAPAYVGPVVMQPGFVSSGARPGPWFIAIQLANPVVYDPSSGMDLLIEVRNPARWSGGSSRDCDAVSSSSLLVSRVRNLTDADALMGTVQRNVGLVCDLFWFDASAGTLQSSGPGCVGSNGVPALAGLGGSVPRIDATFTFEVTQAAREQQVFVLIGFAPLPGLDLGPIGMPGCLLWTDSVFALATTANGLGVANASIGIPDDPHSLGRVFHSQAFIVDPGFNPFQAVVSNGVVATIGL